MKADIGARLLAWAARLGPWWYIIPSLLVVLVGIATCSQIDEPDFDRFVIMSVLPHPSGMRAAVVARQYHDDSNATVSCVWVVAGPPPSPGPSRRLTESCALVATDVDIRLDLNWRRDGRLGVTVPADTGRTETDARSERCYFKIEDLGRHVCYRPELVVVD